MSEGKILPILHIREKTGPRKQPRLVRKGITVAFLATLVDNPDWPIDRICEQYGLTRGDSVRRMVVLLRSSGRN